MPSDQDRIRFLSKKLRLQVAELCSDEARTLGELAAELGRDPRSLSQPTTMAKRGALRKGSRRTGRRATTYRLDGKWRPALEAARRQAPPAVPKTKQDLLFIPLVEIGRAARALADGIEAVEWAAEVRGGMVGLLLAVRQDAAETTRSRFSTGSTPSLRRSARYTSSAR